MTRASSLSHVSLFAPLGERRSFLSQVPLFAPLGEKEQQALEQACRVRTFRAGEVLLHEGDPGHALYILRSGHVKIVLLARDGAEIILDVHGPGACVGELALLDDEPRSATAVALSRVEALVLYREDFLAFLERCPRMARALLRRLAGTVRRVSGQVQDQVSLDIRSRLAKTLLELMDKHGEVTPQGICMAVRLSQQELAQMVGAARSNINKSLGWFAQRGILTVERERIMIHKPQELRKLID